jgi:ABC-type branched-subunit amino acid transport system ATPase component
VAQEAGQEGLRAEGLVRRFGGVAAVDSVSITLAPGEIVAVIGPNGAGKSTLFDLLSGVTAPDAGRLLIGVVEAAGLPPHRIARLGLTRTFQLSRELGRLTVLENLLLAAPDRCGERLRDAFLRPGAVRRAQRAAVEAARAVLAEVGLEGREDALAEELSGGQRKLLELGRALMTGAPLVLLDEVGAGVAPTLRRALSDVVARLRARHGRGFLLVEHDMGLVARLADRVVVMAAGRVLAEGNYEQIRHDTRVVEAYLGAAA